MSLGQLLSALGSMTVLGKPLALEAGVMIGMVIEELRAASDDGSRSTARPSSRRVAYLVVTAARRRRSWTER